MKEQAKVEPTALYVHLALRVVVHWTSFESNVELQCGVSSLFNQILDNLETTYGVVVVRAALGFITFAVDGLTDRELIDLLTLHKEVMRSDLIKSTGAIRFPAHIWLRLRGEVLGLVMEKEDGIVGWFHPQLKEVTEERYKKNKVYLHKVMSKYFGGLISREDEYERGVTLQSLILNGPMDEIWSPKAVINHRRCVEASHHMLAAGWYDESEKELCTMEAVYARAKCRKSTLTSACINI